MTNCCIRVAGNSIFLNFVHSSGEYSAILAATRHGGETLPAISKYIRMKDNVIRTKEDAEEVFWKQPYFAFLDIMGFRELVRNNNHETLVDLYKRLVNFQVKFYSDYHNEEQKARAEKLGEYFEPTGLRLVNISDSIMIWTKNSTENNLIELVSAVKLLMSISMSIGIPLRGSIVKGDVTVLENDNSLSIIGLGLVNAYENEGKQNWSGCTIDSSIIRYLRSYYKAVLGKTETRIEKLNSLIVETEIPIKNPKTKQYEDILGFAVNWADNSEFTDEQIIESFSKYNKRLKETEDITKSIDLKIHNTLMFYRKFGGKK